MMSNDENSQAIANCGSEETKKYWAFISYSSKDKKWGEWLHRRLESYPIPKEFQGTELFDGAVLGKNLRPVFRDRDELAGSSDLGPAILMALKQTRFLIVLCSRNSSKSQWVNKEIEDFKGLGGEKHILALILDGEPNATSNPDLGDSEECFPPALRYPAEPLAGDLRKEGDGKERGFLKVIAGISQLDFDKLYRRHERAQKKKRLVLGTISASIMLLLSGISVYAIQQRDAAIAQEREALAQEEKAVAAAEKAEALNREASRKALGSALEASGRREDPMVGFAYLADALKYDPNSKVANEDAKLHLLRFRRDLAPLPLINIPSNGSEPLSMDLSPDGRHMAVAHENGVAQIWDVATGDPVGKPLQHDGRIIRISFSGDGEKVATASGDKTTKVWEVSTGEQLMSDFGHEDQVFSAMFSPDCAKLVTVSWDGTASIWDISTGEKLVTIQPESIWSAEFSPDGDSVLTAGNGGASIWDANTGGLIWNAYDKGNILSAAFSPDGTRILTGGWGGEVQIWDVITRECLYSDISEHAGVRVQTVLFSSDGTRFATAGEYGGGRIWDAANFEPIGQPLLHDGAVSSIAFSPDGRRVVTAGEDKLAKVWDSSTARQMGSAYRHDAEVGIALYSPDGMRIATASVDGSVNIWGSATGQPTCVNYPGGNWLFDFSPDGRLLVSVDDHDVARVWNVITGEMIGANKLLKSHSGEILFSPDGEQLIVSTSQFAQIWDVEGGEVPRITLDHGDHVRTAFFSPDGNLILTQSNNDSPSRCRLWNSETGEFTGITFEHGAMISSASFSPNGAFILISGLDGYVNIWDVQTGDAVGVPIKHEDAVESAQFDNTGESILTVCRDGVVRIWSVYSGELLSPLILEEEGIVSAEFSPDGESIVTACEGGVAQLWCVATAGKRGLPIYHGGEMTASFSPDGSRVVTSGFEKTVRLWESATARPIGGYIRHPGSAFARFSPDGKRLATLCEDGKIRLWWVDTSYQMTSLDSLLQALSGKKVAGDGMVVDVALTERLGLKQKFLDDNLDDNTRNLVDWIFSAPEGRFLNPGTNIAVDDYITEEIDRMFEEPDVEDANLILGAVEGANAAHPLLPFALGGLEESEKRRSFHFRRGIDRLPADAVLLRKATEYLLKLGNPEGVLEVAGRWLELEPDNEDALDAIAQAKEYSEENTD